MCAVLNCCAYITQIYYIIFFYCWCAFCSIERMTNNPSVIIIHRVSKKLCQCYSLNNNSGVSWSSSALLCLWCDVMWHCPSIWKQVFFLFFHQDRLSWWKKRKKLAFRCCRNVKKQHLFQNDVTIVRPIDFDSRFEPMHALPSMNSLL